MAIDDNTTYGLTGAQIKELPGKIEAVKGLARELTTADYNYPTNSPNRIVLADLPDGFYTWNSSTDMQVSVFRNSTILYTQGGWALVMNDQAATGSAFKGKAVLCNIRGSNIEYWHGTNSSTQNTFYISAPVNSLTSTSTTAPLSANQGKVLNDKIGDLSTLTTTDKTSTVAAINEIAAGGGGGGITELTSADYNYPANSPDGVAFWLLDPGTYYMEPGVKYYWNNNSSDIKGGLVVTDGYVGVLFERNNTQTAVRYFYTSAGAAFSTGDTSLVKTSAIINNLTSTNTDRPLSAAQGKVLNDKIPTITMTTTDPGEGSALAANNFVAVYGTDGDAGYALAETNTGTTWVDGSTIYKKTINFGALPNATTKNVNNGITNLSRIINYEAYAHRSSTPTTIPLPFIDTTNLSRGVNITFGASTIAVTTSVDRSDFDECYITLYYTKSS